MSGEPACELRVPQAPPGATAASDGQFAVSEAGVTLSPLDVLAAVAVAAITNEQSVVQTAPASTSCVSSALLGGPQGPAAITVTEPAVGMSPVCDAGVAQTPPEEPQCPAAVDANAKPTMETEATPDAAPAASTSSTTTVTHAPGELLFAQPGTLTYLYEMAAFLLL